MQILMCHHIQRIPETMLFSTNVSPHPAIERVEFLTENKEHTIGESKRYLGNNYSRDTLHFLMYNTIGGIGRAANEMHLASQHRNNVQ